MNTGSRPVPARIFGLGAVVWLALLAGACGRSEREETVVLAEMGVAAFADTSAALSVLRFPDGTVSLNDRCPVRKSRLNPRMPAIYVNQHPVGFC